MLWADLPIPLPLGCGMGRKHKSVPCEMVSHDSLGCIKMGCRIRLYLLLPIICCHMKVILNWRMFFHLEIHLNLLSKFYVNQKCLNLETKQPSSLPIRLHITQLVIFGHKKTKEMIKCAGTNWAIREIKECFDLDKYIWLKVQARQEFLTLLDIILVWQYIPEGLQVDNKEIWLHKMSV